MKDLTQSYEILQTKAEIPVWTILFLETPLIQTLGVSAIHACLLTMPTCYHGYMVEISSPCKSRFVFVSISVDAEKVLAWINYILNFRKAKDIKVARSPTGEQYAYRFAASRVYLAMIEELKFYPSQAFSLDENCRIVGPTNQSVKYDVYVTSEGRQTNYKSELYYGWTGAFKGTEVHPWTTFSSSKKAVFQCCSVQDHCKLMCKSYAKLNATPQDSALFDAAFLALYLPPADWFVSKYGPHIEGFFEKDVVSADYAATGYLDILLSSSQSRESCTSTCSKKSKSTLKKRSPPPKIICYMQNRDGMPFQFKDYEHVITPPKSGNKIRIDTETAKTYEIANKMEIID